MHKKLLKKTRDLFIWIQKNSSKIFFIILLHIIVTNLFNLPYLNLVKIVTTSLPYFIDWVVIVLIFKLKKDIILKTAIGLFFINYFFDIFKIYIVVETLGVISYFLIANYLIISLKEIRD